MNRLGKIAASGLGTGYLPVAPGTWGSAAVLGVFLAVALATDLDRCGVMTVMAAVAVVSSVICVALGPFVERVWGKKDPGKCTIDEWAGQALALVYLPLSADADSTTILWTAVGAFFAFRVFDIVKPPPARWLEKLPTGWGVLADDLAAGVYATAAVWAVATLAF